jgi:serine/threonine protein kinase HipA of HipAB toxin-antitoxin module
MSAMKPKFIVSAPGQQVPSYYEECRYMKAHTETGSQVISMSPWRTKPFSRKVGRRLGLRSNVFDLTSGGNPVKYSDGTQVRKTTPEDMAVLESLAHRIEALREEHRLALISAWKNGETVHETDAVNHPIHTEGAQPV